MTPKERVLAAIAHTEPDRVPTGEWEFGREAIEPLIGRNTYCDEWASKHAYWAGERNRVVSEWKNGLLQAVECYHWDAVLVHLCIGNKTPIERPEPIGKNQWRLACGDIITYSPETDGFLITARGATESVATPEGNDSLEEPDDSELEVVRHIVAAIGKTHFVFGAPLSGHPAMHYDDATRSELENWVQVWQDPEQAARIRLRQATSPSVRRGMAIARHEGLDGVAMGCDYGYNKGPFLSPELFRRVVFPALQAWCACAHEHGLIALLHACGNNAVLMDQIVEAGVDVYQSIQSEMNLVQLKKRYGKQITFWGGVPAGDLITETPQRIEKIARHYLENCKPGGGYIFSTSHSIMPQTKIENYQAMLAALAKYGRYARTVSCSKKTTRPGRFSPSL